MRDLCFKDKKIVELAILFVVQAVGDDVLHAKRECINRNSLIGVRRIGEPQLVNVNTTTIVLTCNYCGEDILMGDFVIGAIWTLDPIINSTGPEPIIFDSKKRWKWLHGRSKNNVSLGEHHELVLRHPTIEHTGLYFCTHTHGPERGRPLRYLVDSKVNSADIDIDVTFVCYADRSVSMSSGFRLTRTIPDFLEVDNHGCAGICPKRLKRRALWSKAAPLPPVPKYSYELGEGDDLLVLCPGATMESSVRWERDGLPVDSAFDSIPHPTSMTRTTKKKGFFQRWREKGEKVKRKVHGFGKKKKEGRRGVMVDTMGVMRVYSAKGDDAGLYTCAFGDHLAARVRLRVISRSKLSLSDTARHALYLLCVVLLCLLVYCTTLAVMCHSRLLRRHRYARLQTAVKDKNEKSRQRAETRNHHSKVLDAINSDSGKL